MDAATSLIALVSILGSSLGGYSFLDPIGGIAVSLFILRQGFFLTRQAFAELLDKGVDARSRRRFEEIVGELVDGEEILSITNIRGVKSGGESGLIFLALGQPHCLYPWTPCFAFRSDDSTTWFAFAADDAILLA